MKFSQRWVQCYAWIGWKHSSWFPKLGCGNSKHPGLVDNIVQVQIIEKLVHID